jgi:RNA polymerase sigma factor for flagellar operon FliA
MSLSMYAAYASDAAGPPAAVSAAQEQQVLLAHAPMVKRIVRQLATQATAAVSREDMEQVGLIGLLEALRRYGPPDERFEAFAAMRVRGAILDELRRQDWRPRGVRQESHRVRDGVRELRRKLGREPQEGEIAAALNITAEAYRQHMQDESAEELASFDELVTELAHVPSDHASPEATTVARLSLERALQVLDEREQRVVQLYYEYELSLKEIAAVLGLTEARVCQINKGALARMKAFIAAA